MNFFYDCHLVIHSISQNASQDIEVALFVFNLAIQVLLDDVSNN